MPQTIQPRPIPIPIPIPVPQPTPQVTVTALPSPTLGGAIGSDFLSAQSRLLFVEYSGNLSRYDLHPAASVLTSGTVVLKSSYGFNLDAGTESAQGAGNAGMDFAWNQVEPEGMYALNGATIVNLGAASYNAITASALQGLSYGTAYIPDAALVAGEVFAVHTIGGNYAKVEVVSIAGFNMTIQWTTYQFGSAYAVLGTGYTTPEDVKASADGVHVYVTERTGDLVEVAYSSPNRSQARVVASGMTAPQQLFLDEANNAAYTVEYTTSGRLLRINLTTGAQTTVLSGLNNAVGVVLSSDRQYAYIGEQTTGALGGTVSRYQLSNGAKTVLASGLTAPFFLTWMDDSEAVLYVPQREPSNTLVAVNVATGTVNTVATGLASQPSSVAVVNAATLLVCCNTVIDELVLPGGGDLLPGGPLLEGIGYIPFDWITGGGLADTSAHPTYHFQAIDAPFGGDLWVVVNFIQANLDGAAYYQVFMDNVVRTDVFHGAQWNGTEYIDAVLGTATVGSQAGCYAVLTPIELSTWEGTPPGCFLDSTTLTSGMVHQLTVQFLDGSGNVLSALTPAAVPVYVDNRKCTATIAQAQWDGVPATACGYLGYASTGTVGDPLGIVTVNYTAAQPGNFANYAFDVIRGVTNVSSASGPVNPPPPAFTESVVTLLGGCSIAGFAASVYVSATAIDGISRQSEYDAYVAEAFVLAPQ